MVRRMDVKNEEVAELLEAVADGYESGQYEWIQGAYTEPLNAYVDVDVQPKGMCSLGALAHFSRGRNGTIYAQGLATLGASIIPFVGDVYDEDDAGSLGAYVPNWNDDPERTKDQVIDHFKQVAKDLRNEAGVTL